MYVCTMYVCIYKSNDCENEKNVEEKKKITSTEVIKKDISIKEIT